MQQRLTRFAELTRDYLATLPAMERNLETWDHTVPVTLGEAIRAFLVGRQWLTASFWQDWYGVLPLFAGSLLVSLVALAGITVVAAGEEAPVSMPLLILALAVTARMA